MISPFILPHALSLQHEVNKQAVPSVKLTVNEAGAVVFLMAFFALMTYFSSISVYCYGDRDSE